MLENAGYAMRFGWLELFAVDISEATAETEQVIGLQSVVRLFQGPEAKVFDIEAGILMSTTEEVTPIDKGIPVIHPNLRIQIYRDREFVPSNNTSGFVFAVHSQCMCFELFRAEYIKLRFPSHIKFHFYQNTKIL
jgi:hypothetical protein